MVTQSINPQAANYKLGYPEDMPCAMTVALEMHTAKDNNPIDPNHYHTAIEPIKYILANELGFCEGNVVKYVTRWREKGGVEDLKKAKQYIDFLIEAQEP